MRESERELSTALFLLRVTQLGIPIRDLDLLTIGMVTDMFTESANDDYEWPDKATQDDFDNVFSK